MKYRTNIAAAILSLFSLAAFADDQQSNATPEATHKTGQASAQRSDEGSDQNASPPSGQSREASSRTGETSSASSVYASLDNNDDQANSDDQAGNQPKQLVIVVSEQLQGPMEDLIAFLRSSPDASVTVVSEDESEQNEAQDTFTFSRADEDEDE